MLLYLFIFGARVRLLFSLHLLRLLLGDLLSSTRQVIHLIVGFLHVNIITSIIARVTSSDLEVLLMRTIVMRISFVKASATRHLDAAWRRRKRMRGHWWWRQSRGIALRSDTVLAIMFVIVSAAVIVVVVVLILVVGGRWRWR